MYVQTQIRTCLSLTQFVVITVCLKAGLETSSWTMVSIWMTLSIPLTLFCPISLCPPISFHFIVPLSVETRSSTPSHSSHSPFSSAADVMEKFREFKDDVMVASLIKYAYIQICNYSAVLKLYCCYILYYYYYSACKAKLSI